MRAARPCHRYLAPRPQCSVTAVQPRRLLTTAQPNPTSPSVGGCPADRPIRLPRPVHTGSVKRSVLTFGSVIMAASLGCACSSTNTSDSRQSEVVIRSTQFAPAPEPVTDHVPTARQLTVLFNASLDYSIREEGRARLIEGDSDENLPLARAWGAQTDAQRVDFTTVAPVDSITVQASGQTSVDGVQVNAVGPIPFVLSGGEWTVSRTFVCDMMSFRETQHICA